MSLVLLVAVGCGGVSDSTDQPSLESIEPAVGPQAGGTVVTVTGSGFTADAAAPARVAIGNLVVAAEVESDTVLRFTTPAGVEGTVDVGVFHEGGSSTLFRAFQYAPLPTVDTIDPTFVGDGQPVTITGSGFALLNPGTPSVTVGGVALTDVQVVSENRLTGTLGTPTTGAFESVDVEVTTAFGSATLPGAFRYTRPGFLIPDRIQPNRWFWVDPATGELVEYPVIAPSQVHKVATADNGDVYGILPNPKSIVQIDTRTLAASFRFALPADVRAGDLEIDGDRLFIIQSRNGQPANMHELRQFDLATGSLVSSAPTLLGDFSRCIFRNDASSLFVIQELNGPLRTVDKANGALTTIGTLNGPAGLFCHSSAVFGSQRYVLGWDFTTLRGTLFAIDVATATLTETGQLPEVLSFRAKSIVATPADF